MNCYICEHQSGPGGTHYHVREAVGVCHHCGVGVCLPHSHKSDEPGAPMLCLFCASILHDQMTEHSTNGQSKKTTNEVG